MFDHGVGIEGMSLRKSFGEGDVLGSEVFIVLRGGRGACLTGFSTPYQAHYYPASALPHPKSTSGRIEEGRGRLNRAPVNTEGPPPCQLCTAVDPSSSAWLSTDLLVIGGFSLILKLPVCQISSIQSCAV